MWSTFGGIIFLYLAGSGFAMATELPVLYEDGKTYSIEPYTGKMIVESMSPDQGTWDEAENFGFPVTTGLWRIGSFNYKPEGLPGLPLNFYIVGCNPESQRWLRARKAELLEMRALGLVVECRSRQELEKMRSEFTPLVLQPMQGDDLALKLNHYEYPALVTRSSIEQ